MTFDALNRYGAGGGTEYTDTSGNTITVGGGSSYDPVRRGTNRLISPVPPFTASQRNVGSGERRAIVPGPLDVWEYENSRPYEQVGKFGVNLQGLATPYGSQGVTAAVNQAPRDMAGQLTAMADPANPQNRGFFEGMFGFVGGLTQQQFVKDVGSFIGSIVDAPLEAAGNTFGMVGAALTTALTQGFGAKWDPDIQAAFDASVRENPINMLLMPWQAHRAQWTREQMSGLNTEQGLAQHMGPAVALTDQLGFLMSVMGLPQQMVARATRGGSAEVATGLEMVAQAASRGSTEGLGFVDPQWTEIAERAIRGDFGDPNSERGRDLIQDALISSGGALHDPTKETDIVQNINDVLYMLASDPLLVASAFTGGASLGVKAGATAASQKFWQVFPTVGLRTQALQDAGRIASRLTGVADPDAALGLMSRAAKPVEGQLRGPALEQAVLRETAELPQFAAQREAALKAADYIDFWRNTAEPALRPISNAVQVANDPWRLFGSAPGKVKSAVDRSYEAIFSSNLTEGWIRGQGSLFAHTQLQNTIRMLGGDEALRAYNKGLGSSAAFFSRVYVRDGIVRELRNTAKRNGAPSIAHYLDEVSPDDLITARMDGIRGSDIATDVEMLALRYRPLYLATEVGGKAAALVRGREEAAKRLVLMNVPEAQAAKMVADLNVDHLSLIDGAYFGVAKDEFTALRRAAIAGQPPKLKRGQIDAQNLTILGPRQMTMQIAEEVRTAARAGDLTAVREALRQYDLLFHNIGEGLDDADLLRTVERLLTDNIDNKALPTDVALEGLPRGIQDWAAKNADLGYRPGYRPDADNLWLATADEDGNIIGINPWVDLTDDVADVPTYKRWHMARELLLHNVRGERIMADARVRLAEYTSDRWGVPKGSADALFARFLIAAQDQVTTPRGLTPQKIYRIVQTTGLPDEVVDKITVRDAIEALMVAFEGKTRHVGLTQKFTGKAKTLTGGQGNYIGQVAERIYPAVRYTLNPLFIAQELVEPFILGIMRGVKPGWKASEMDDQTLRLIEVIQRDSKYAYDDTVEKTTIGLGAYNAAKRAFDRGSRLGKMVRGGLDTINIASIKQINLARAARRRLGVEFRDAMEQVAPDWAAKAPIHYGTSDWGDIAVRYLSEKGQIHTNPALYKPSGFGARSLIELDEAARPFEQYADGSALQMAVRDRSLDREEFRQVLKDAGAEDDYINRAWTTANFSGTLDEYWEAYRVNFAFGNKVQTDETRRLLRGVADGMGMSELEFIAKYQGDIPQSEDAAVIASMTARERKFLQFMAETGDAAEGQIGRAVDDTVEMWRQADPRFAGKEHFAIVDDQGRILNEGAGPPWRMDVAGRVSEAHIRDFDFGAALDMIKGRVMVHSHPSYVPFSPADLTSMLRYQPARMVVTSPGTTHSMLPPASGWYNQRFLDEFGEPPLPGLSSYTKGMADMYWRDVQGRLTEMWDDAVVGVDQVLRQIPFYSDPRSTYWQPMVSEVAVTAANESLARRFGWRFSSDAHMALPSDPFAREALLKRMALEGAPAHLVRDHPDDYRARPLESHDMSGKGVEVSAEYTSVHRPWEPQISEAQQRLVMDSQEDRLRAIIGPRIGVGISHVTRAAGGWMSPEGYTNATNAVFDLFGTIEQAEDYAAAIGYLLRQNAVVVSKVKSGLGRAVLDDGERWSWEFVAGRQLSSDEAIDLQERLTRAVPEVSDWGSSIVRTDDGRTAVRFVNGYLDEPTGEVAREDFITGLTPESRAKVEAELADFGDNVDVHAEVVDYRYVENDWEAHPDGQGYLEGLRTRNPSLATDLSGRYRKEFDDALAADFRTHAPAEFDAHLDSLRAAGRDADIPDFGIPGEYQPVRPGVILSLPEGLDEPDRALNIWEQMLVKAQRINADALYNSDPDLAVRLMDAVHGSKFKNLTAADSDFAQRSRDVHRFNSFAFAALTSNAALDVTEGAFARVRASLPGTITFEGARQSRGLPELIIRARRIVGTLPERYQSQPAARGIALQIDEGMRINGWQVEQGASWLNPRQRASVSNLSDHINERLRGLSDEEREEWVPRIQRVLDGSTARRGQDEAQRAAAATQFRRDVREVHAFLDLPDNLRRRLTGFSKSSNSNMQVHAFPTGQSPRAGTPNLFNYISVPRPEVRFKSSSTNTAWGRVLGWLNDGIFDSGNPALQKFLWQQPGEGTSQWALRVSSILPGIDVKTGLLAASSAGPSRAAHGALDTHMVRFITQWAQRNGDLDGLLDQLDPTFAEGIRTRLAAGSEAFMPPKAVRHTLASRSMGEWSDKVLARMRQNLSKITDPEVRALYEDSEVLRRVYNAGGYVTEWGGDYKVIEDYMMGVIRADEVARLRQRGNTFAADRIEAYTAGQYQWLLWDRIRSATHGIPLDPHVSVSTNVAKVMPRSGVELDSAIGRQRLGTPYDPTQRFLLQQQDGQILGATKFDEDWKAVIVATQHADVRTGLHELAHVFEKTLDPSLRERILAEYRAATGSRIRVWPADSTSDTVGEWWADQFLNYVRTARAPRPELRPTFDYFKRQIGTWEATIRAERESAVLATAKTKAVSGATSALEAVKPQVRPATAAVRKAEQAHATAARNLKRARGRTGLDVLGDRRALAINRRDGLGGLLSEAKGAVRGAKTELREAKIKAKAAQGTRSAGGSASALRRKQVKVEQAEDEVRRLEEELRQARDAATAAIRDYNGAAKRTPLEAHIAARDKARGALDEANAHLRQINEAAEKATSELQAAQRLKVKAPRRVQNAPRPSKEMNAIFGDILRAPKADRNIFAGGPLPGMHFDAQEEAMYQAAVLALSRAEENAFTLQYYKRGRNLVERSINHPYFGLYPASYMWGKILPEMLRFLVKTPFGLDAPMGGAVLANNLYKGVMLQQQYDEDFREWMVNNTDAFHLMALMTPSLPWEVPVNAPLWARRGAEASLTQTAKVEAGEAAPMMGLGEFGDTVSEMLKYAFGPANAAEQFSAAASAAFGLGDETFSAATQQVNTLLGGPDLPPQGAGGTFGQQAPPTFGLPSAALQPQAIRQTAQGVGLPPQGPSETTLPQPGS